jgi:hypothetical protein
LGEVFPQSPQPGQKYGAESAKPTLKASGNACEEILLTA